MIAITWDGDGKDAKMVEGPIPADLADKAAEYRAALIEAAVEMDDTALEAFLDGKEPDEDTLRKLIRKATVTRAFYPMMCGSAFKNKGVQPLLDAVVDFLPSPLDREAYAGIDPKTGGEILRRPSDMRAAVHDRLQDHELRARRLDHVLPSSTRARSSRAWRSRTRRVTRKSAPAACT